LQAKSEISYSAMVHYILKNNRLLLLLLALTLCQTICSQRITVVCGEIDYFVPETQSLAEAKRTAIARARLKALADEFGTMVAQTNTVTIHSSDDKALTNFNSYSENEVLGLWISDTKEPVVDVKYQNDNMVIHAAVCGKAREQKRTTAEMQVKVFNRDFETTNFRNNDRLSVGFKSAASGYVALFIREDASEIVNVMMPYEGGDGNAREVKSNRDYIFLTTSDPDYPYNEETILVTDKSVENNTLIVVFSQKPFHVSLTNKGEFVPQVDDAKFRKWLHNLRVYDTTVQTEEIVLTIKK